MVCSLVNDSDELRTRVPKTLGLKGQFMSKFDAELYCDLSCTCGGIQNINASPANYSIMGISGPKQTVGI